MYIPFSISGAKSLWADFVELLFGERYTEHRDMDSLHVIFLYTNHLGGSSTWSDDGGFTDRSAWKKTEISLQWLFSISYLCCVPVFC